ncbi:MAG TPA: tetratricopeptide repeat protein [Phycisphaerales bacterium]|nr:tetratricopeptide repeat protein [Phycisphaerales bacterium]
MPGHPDPRLNLALALEQAGRIDDALEEYRAALEVYPEHIQSVQAITRCRIRYRPDELAGDPLLGDHLRLIAHRGETPEWREWARRQLVLVE